MEHILIGIFLLIIGIAMAFMALVYFKTRKMSKSWSIFSILYTIRLLVLFTNNPIKDSLKITSIDNVYSNSFCQGVLSNYLRKFACDCKPFLGRIVPLTIS